jgi:hypothetical protein
MDGQNVNFPDIMTQTPQAIPMTRASEKIAAFAVQIGIGGALAWGALVIAQWAGGRPLFWGLGLLLLFGSLFLMRK